MLRRTLCLALSSVLSQICFAQEAPATLDKPSPDTKIAQAKERFNQEMTRLRQDVVTAYSAKIEAVRTKSGVAEDRKAKMVEALKEDLEKFKASETRAPSIEDLKDNAKKLESGAKAARIQLRKDVSAAAVELKRIKRNDEAEAALIEVERIAPNCVNVPAFAARMKDHRENLINQVIKGKANPTTFDVRERLDEMVTRAAAGTISAHDLTDQCKKLLETIDGSQAVKSGKGRHKDLLEDAAAAIRVLLAVKE